MSSFTLQNIDPLDLDDTIESIEKTFHIRFENDEFKSIRTFGELCKMVEEKTNAQDTLDCTTQQTFYKLRAALYQILHIDTISPKTELESIFPSKNRKNLLLKFQETLGIKLDLLYPPVIFDYIFMFGVLFGIVLLFTNYNIGIPTLIISMLALVVGKKIGNSFRIKTLGDLAKQLRIENYSEVRSIPNTTNKNEISKTIQQIFIKKTGIDSNKLIEEASFYPQ